MRVLERRERGIRSRPWAGTHSTALTFNNSNNGVTFPPRRFACLSSFTSTTSLRNRKGWGHRRLIEQTEKPRLRKDCCPQRTVCTGKQLGFSDRSDVTQPPSRKQMAPFEELIHGGLSGGAVHRGVHRVEGNREGTARARQPQPPSSLEGQRGRGAGNPGQTCARTRGPPGRSQGVNTSSLFPLAPSYFLLVPPMGQTHGSQRTMTPSAAGEVSFPPPRAGADLVGNEGRPAGPGRGHAGGLSGL